MTKTLLLRGRLNTRVCQRVACFEFIVIVFLMALFAPATSAQVTPQRLVDSGKEPQNWLMYSGDYAGNRFSARYQINVAHEH
jgi:glucose dehydrogenase